ncbi:hypothetical protein BXZ70DRAFT_741777 [Cristinia sonorae]|uniref:Uncharacterized protein n=1 Tax=Cristinia sonorae TaxID=1940300 RepID=A0A8K0UVQ4_9AGAR|nr:hypothetical protein BXZ70DRAFT_741777 [Cristinia sonorae]
MPWASSTSLSPGTHRTCVMLWSESAFRRVFPNNAAQPFILWIPKGTNDNRHCRYFIGIWSNSFFPRGVEQGRSDAGRTQCLQAKAQDNAAFLLHSAFTHHPSTVQATNPTTNALILLYDPCQPNSTLSRKFLSSPAGICPLLDHERVAPSREASYNTNHTQWRSFEKPPWRSHDICFVVPRMMVGQPVFSCLLGKACRFMLMQERSHFPGTQSCCTYRPCCR